MSMHVQALRDAENVDHGPFFDFCQWVREHDNCGCGSFGNHYNLEGQPSSIVDLDSLKKEIEDALASTHPDQLKPPDVLAANILIWLTQRLADGVVLAYVAW